MNPAGSKRAGSPIAPGIEGEGAGKFGGQPMNYQEQDEPLERSAGCFWWILAGFVVWIVIYVLCAFITQS